MTGRCETSTSPAPPADPLERGWVREIARDRPSRKELSRAALAWRAAHTAITLGFLSAIGYVWWCALTGRRGPLLPYAVSALVGEGLFVAANGGDCPLGGLQERFGDPTPSFELVLPPTAARRAVPILGAITTAGLLLLAARSPSLKEAVGGPGSNQVTEAR